MTSWQSLYASEGLCAMKVSICPLKTFIIHEIYWTFIRNFVATSNAIKIKITIYLLIYLPIYLDGLVCYHCHDLFLFSFDRQANNLCLIEEWSKGTVNRTIEIQKKGVLYQYVGFKVKHFFEEKALQLYFAFFSTRFSWFNLSLNFLTNISSFVDFYKQ